MELRHAPGFMRFYNIAHTKVHGIARWVLSLGNWDVRVKDNGDGTYDIDCTKE